MKKPKPCYCGKRHKTQAQGIACIKRRIGSLWFEEMLVQREFTLKELNTALRRWRAYLKTLEPLGPRSK